MNKRLVGVNEKGLRVGQDHQRAKLTDRDVELMRQLHEQRMPRRDIAEKFEVSESTVDKIVNYRRRAQMPVKFRSI
ncbi:helix-turn-helix domain-containing protein [Caballeronia zhejiangensis]|uniref:helix-turn-helix domain-containing protein n=1 Tax=Caballeronia zhejiangensis TaxID=871203 RepID=UPI0015883507|nr:helix-turn-helix domain-containing protein [Caballeronia zhejiangensis]